ncbi:Regulator of chromosome condensation RCC1 [Arabidopsis thaliana x Arabidopsis arenosa]|uniref:Regulator of chromosome condensation RCC1 n=1 Tax=Arabidopsis thaliana x Arabidopsis arenosa TaxID=1240361 RepID=A0A8T1YV69_9BRAS|nr:Regulator of chromosome condensation RCC1 [Arabidopsis thaliana x Arabidopsis arenosa]
MLTRAIGRVRIPVSRIQGSNYTSGFLKDSKLGPIGVSCRRWLSNESGKRFAAMWGSGDYGRLGLGNLDSQWTPAVCSALSDHSIRAVACGGAHTLFLTETRRVFATGLNDCGQLGVSDVKSHAMDPLEVSGLDKDILHISAGYYHSAAITVDGELYMWGKNSSGQLGLGKKAARVVRVPTKVQALHGITIQSVALGSEHSVAVTDGGEVLSWGGGGSGRLGHGHQSSLFGILRSNSEFTPRLIKELEGIKVKNVAAGLLHSACTDENGSAFMFGERSINKMGFGGVRNATTPSIISEVPYAEEVACGGYHTCVVTRGGDLYTWGSNENGCLGTDSTYVSHSPVRVEGPFLESTVSQVSCGWKHTAAISDNKVFTWGWGGSHGTFSVDGHSSGGQLGHGSDVDYARPAMVDLGKNVRAVHISCGFNHTAAVLEHF